MARYAPTPTNATAHLYSDYYFMRLQAFTEYAALPLHIQIRQSRHLLFKVAKLPHIEVAEDRSARTCPSLTPPLDHIRLHSTGAISN